MFHGANLTKRASFAQEAALTIFCSRETITKRVEETNREYKTCFTKLASTVYRAFQGYTS